MSEKSIYFIIGRKLGWWLATNRDALVRQAVVGVIRKLPGVSWLIRLFR